MAKWLEIIEIQTGLDKASKLKHVLANLAKELLKNPDLHKVKIYDSHFVESDFSIHLIHRSSIPGPAGSVAGVHIAAVLKEYGIMNHQVWCEIKSKNGSTIEFKG